MSNIAKRKFSTSIPITKGTQMSETGKKAFAHFKHITNGEKCDCGPEIVRVKPRKARPYKEYVKVKQGSMNELHTKRFIQVREYWEKNGVIPSVREMAVMFKVKSTFSAYKSLLHMLVNGKLKKVGLRVAPGIHFNDIGL